MNPQDINSTQPLPRTQALQNSTQKNKVLKAAGMGIGGLGLVGLLSGAAWGMSRSGTPNELQQLVEQPTPEIEATNNEPVAEPIEETNVETLAQDSPANDTPTHVFTTTVEVSEVSRNELSFSHAFADAREELGAGGVFEWHGNFYSTFYKEEWESMSADEKHAFADSFHEEQYNPEVHGEIVSVSTIETLVAQPSGEQDMIDVAAGGEELIDGSSVANIASVQMNEDTARMVADHSGSEIDGSGNAYAMIDGGEVRDEAGAIVSQDLMVAKGLDIDAGGELLATIDGGAIETSAETASESLAFGESPAIDTQPVVVASIDGLDLDTEANSSVLETVVADTGLDIDSEANALMAIDGGTAQAPPVEVVQTTLADIDLGIVEAAPIEAEAVVETSLDGLDGLVAKGIDAQIDTETHEPQIEMVADVQVEEQYYEEQTNDEPAALDDAEIISLDF